VLPETVPKFTTEPSNYVFKMFFESKIAFILAVSINKSESSKSLVKTKSASTTYSDDESPDSAF
jgi:hypothetical protein